MKRLSLLLALALLTGCHTYQSRTNYIPPENIMKWNPQYWAERMNPGARAAAQRQVELMLMMQR